MEGGRGRGGGREGGKRGRGVVFFCGWGEGERRERVGGGGGGGVCGVGGDQQGGFYHKETQQVKNQVTKPESQHVELTRSNIGRSSSRFQKWRFGSWRNT